MFDKLGREIAVAVESEALDKKHNWLVCDKWRIQNYFEYEHEGVHELIGLN